MKATEEADRTTRSIEAAGEDRRDRRSKWPDKTDNTRERNRIRRPTGDAKVICLRRITMRRQRPDTTKQQRERKPVEGEDELDIDASTEELKIAAAQRRRLKTIKQLFEGKTD